MIPLPSRFTLFPYTTLFRSNADYSTEPTTLVEFELKEVAGGTLLTVVESGFDGIPAHRRGDAYRGNEQGWTIDRKSTRLNSSHRTISYAVFCLKKKKKKKNR